MKYKSLPSLHCYRLLSAALVCVCAFSLSAQTYYRVHKDEFAYIAKFLNEANQNSFSFAIVSPEDGVAMSNTSTTATIKGLEVNLSDDFESMTAIDSNINFIFESTGTNAEGNPEYPIRIIKPSSLTALGYKQGSSSYQFTYESEPYSAISKLYVGYDANDNRNAYLRFDIKNTSVGVGYALTVTGENYAFKLLTDESPLLGIYRLDYFDWEIDDSKLSAEGTLTFKSMPIEELTKFVSYIDIHYILNDGEEVSIDELINSQNRLKELRIKKGQEFSVSIPVEDTASRSAGDNNTIWMLPVLHDSDTDLVPLGKVITKKYADDGISTGVVIAVEDVAVQEPVYYTLDGRKAEMPLVPGVYVRRIGDKADKVIIR